MRRTWLEAAAEPVSGASIALFRIAFGVFMVIDVGLYLPQLVSAYYVDTTFNFAYDPWRLVRPVPGAYGVHLVYVAMGVAGALIAVGLWYRWAAAAFFVCTTYVFLLDSTFFQNHEYLISLVSFALILLPAHRMWSVDARRRPALASSTQPAWILWFLRLQLGLPYVYGGIAKLNPDWLAGEPLRMWLAARTDVPIIGPSFTDPNVVWFATYGSLILDLTVVGFLLHRRTRVPAFVVATLFHLLNARLFGLFVFPWVMIVATSLFFAPDWPLQVRDRWRRRREEARRVGDGDELPERPQPVGADTFDGTTASGGTHRLRTGVAAVLTLWVLVQLTVPLRHLFIPGDPNWTEQGHRFAWHMMLRSKSETLTITVDDGQEVWVEDPLDHLSEAQVARLGGHPERLARFAHHLSALYDGAAVRAETAVALNGRDPVPIVDPDLDLSSVQVPWWGHADWILDNPEPLRPDHG